MGEKRKIILVINQKGGVGKSTVCMALANYLSQEKKVLVGGIIDTDPQLSVYKKRQSDLKLDHDTEEPKQVPLYDISSFSLDNYEQIPSLVQQLRANQGYYIFDTPPSQLQHPGIIWLLASADIILIPYFYDALVLASTFELVILWNNLNEEYRKNNPEGKGLSGKLIFIPALIIKTIGTVQQIQQWAKVKAKYEEIGYVAPAIPHASKLKLCDTISLTKQQLAFVKPCFDSLYQQIINLESQNTNGKQQPTKSA